MRPYTASHIGLKSLTAPAVWVLFFIVSFRVLARYPSNLYEILFSGLIILSTFVILYDFSLSLRKGKFNYLQILFVALSMLPIMASVRAQTIFHQPFIIGLLAQRSFFILYAGYFLLFALRKKWIRIERLNKWFVVSLFVIMGIMLFFSIFIDPLKYSNTEFVEYSMNKGWHYEFPTDVVAALIIFSAIRFLDSTAVRYLFAMALGVIYFLVYLQDRSQLLFIFLTMFLYYLKNFGIRKQLIYLMSGTIFSIIAIGFLIVLAPNFMQHYSSIYSNASTIVLGGTTTEYSTNARIAEGAIAISGIKKHPWLGNGYLSSKFKGGFSAQFGYFYASDVGILGNLFVYGIIGFILLYLMFILPYRWSKQTTDPKDDFLKVYQYILVFIFLDMITAASNLRFIGLLGFSFCILYYYRFMHEQQKQDHQADKSISLS